eukprot:m.97645 g.97645  ORF g.97645 m.97645 type:complete len:520 (+) comp14838_c0_seq2:31-1590(+)
MAVPHTRLQLHIQCSDLRKSDAFSKSDPFVVLFAKAPGGSLKEIGRTEVQKNQSSPKFANAIDIDYYFESVQDLRFAVYDEDSSSTDLSKQDFLGSSDVRLSEIVGIHRGVYTQPLQDKHGKQGHRGSITVTAEEDKQAAGNVEFALRGVGLDKKDLFGKSDPFVKISRQGPAGWTLVHTTEVIKKTLNPTWKPFVVALAELCNGDYDRPLKFDTYDWDSDGGHDLIGSFETTLRTLLEAKNFEAQLINPKKVSKKHYQNSGILVFDKCLVSASASFFDYLRAGFQLNFTVAIDFTASNGQPRLPSSLHYINPSQPNSYMQAIQAVGNVINDYDADKYYPAFGFGCRYQGRVSMEHPLTGDASNPYCQGIEGLLAAYQATLHNVELYGPTNMAPIIRHVAGIASRPEPKAYYVLLIITDGAISDMGETTQAIIEASRLPMSIIIVGVGNADFSSMEFLDSDSGPLTFQGQYAVRDIVQFVPFNQFKARPDAQAALAQAVLAEIPHQFETFMKDNGIPPQ